MTGLIDVLAMLLSADWFIPYWTAIGIDLDRAMKESLQQGCHKIVTHMVGGANEYWLISFSDDRRNQTQFMLESLVQSIGAGPIVLEVVDEWARMSDANLKAGSLFDGLTDDFLSGDPLTKGSLSDPKIIEILHSLRERQEKPSVNFEELCVRSASAWDRYLKQLTPDLPTYLAEILCSFIRARRFGLLWESALHSLTSEESRELASCYRTAAKSLTRIDIAPTYLADDMTAT